jgi:hypothetical protein
MALRGVGAHSTIWAGVAAPEHVLEWFLDWMVDKNSTNNFHPCPEPYLHHLTQRQKCELQMRSHNKFLKCNFTFCVSTIKTTLFQIFVCQICSLGSVVRAVRYITERLPVLIQAVCFCPSGESARTLFKSSESKLTLSNKQNRPHRGSHTEPPRGPTPLAPSVCERIFFHFCLTTVYNPRCSPDWNETSERIDPHPIYPWRLHSWAQNVY